MLTNSSPTIGAPLALLTDDSYEAIRIKDLTNTQPTAFYYNPTFCDRWAVGSVFVPVPDSDESSPTRWRSTTLSATDDVCRAGDGLLSA